MVIQFHAVPNEPISLEEYDGMSGRTPIPFRLQLIPRFDALHEIVQSADETPYGAGINLQ